MDGRQLGLRVLCLAAIGLPLFARGRTDVGSISENRQASKRKTGYIPPVLDPWSQPDGSSILLADTSIEVDVGSDFPTPTPPPPLPLTSNESDVQMASVGDPPAAPALPEPPPAPTKAPDVVSTPSTQTTTASAAAQPSQPAPAVSPGVAAAAPAPKLPGQPYIVGPMVAAPVTGPIAAGLQSRLPSVPVVSIILTDDHFYPAHVRLREGVPAKLIFTTTNRKPAALIVERLRLQRWIANAPSSDIPERMENSRWEINRELNAARVTEIVWEPQRGTYVFHDALTGARGEIVVE